jgi:D-3-phosphoglycerate dehydrogenase
MSDTVENLILDLLEWLGPRPRPYPEVLDAWRTSCPRLPVWEEVTERGYVERHHVQGSGPFVSVTEVGVEHLRTCGRHGPAGISADQRARPVGLSR